MSLSHLSPIQLIFDILYCGSWLLVMNFTYPYRFSRRVTYLLEIVWLILCIVVPRSLPFMSSIRTIFSISLNLSTRSVSGLVRFCISSMHSFRISI